MGSNAYTDDGMFNSAAVCCVATQCSLKMDAFVNCKDGALLVADDARAGAREGCAVPRLSCARGRLSSRGPARPRPALHAGSEL